MIRTVPNSKSVVSDAYMRVTRVTLAMLAALVVSLWGTGATSADGELQVSVRNLDTSGYPVVQLLATVIGPDGRPVAGLTSRNLTLTSQSPSGSIELTSVQSVIDARVGVSSLLLIDTSGSMLAGQAIDRSRDA